MWWEATDNHPPKQNFLGPRIKEFLRFLVWAVEKRHLLWPAERRDIELLPKLSVCSWDVIRNCTSSPRIVSGCRWPESWRTEDDPRRHCMCWIVALGAVSILCLWERWQWAAGRPSHASGRMACDATVLCGHRSDRRAASIITGQKETWMTSLCTLGLESVFP